MTEIIIFPDFAKLKEEIKQLREEVAALICQKDELILITCKNIEYAYYLTLGQLEYKAYNLKIHLNALKRKAELIQMQINRQQEVDINKINASIENELEAFKKLLSIELDKINKAIEWKNLPRLTDEENRELKKIYRQIAKTLHPDLNPGITDEQLHLFKNAIEAYQNGDLPTLKFISFAISNEQIDIANQETYQKIRDEKIKLQKSIMELKINIEKIKSTYPYTLKKIIDNKQKTAERKEELFYIISEYEGAICYYETRIEELLKH